MTWEDKIVGDSFKNIINATIKHLNKNNALKISEGEALELFNLPAKKQAVSVLRRQDATPQEKAMAIMAKYLKKQGEGLVRVTIGSTEDLAANKAIKQEFYELDDSEKDAQLWKILGALPDDAKMVTFANTKRRIDYLANACWSEGFGASAIHG